MKNILLGAKYIAIKYNSKTISLKHIKITLSMLEFYDDELRDKIFTYLGSSYSKIPNIFTQEILDNVESHKKIKFGSKTKRFITYLEKKGYKKTENRITTNMDIILDDICNVFDLDNNYFEDEEAQLEDEEVQQIEENKDNSISTNNQKSDPIKLAIELKEKLSNKIYGQDLAINAVVDSFKNKILESKDRPAHTFLFLGPPATGKTMMAKQISEAFEDYEFFNLSMTSYQSEKNGDSIFGTERIYGNALVGQLTDFVRLNPKSVILIDEFEKAHTTIQKKFLTIFSEGYLKDGNGWIYDEYEEKYIPFNSNEHEHKSNQTKVISKIKFDQTIIIMTSNLGTELYNNSDFTDNIDNDKAELMILQSLQSEKKIEEGNEVLAIVPEMLSRLSQGKIVLFNKLSFENLLKISKDVFLENIKIIRDIYDVKLIKSKSVDYLIQCLLLKFSPELDIRRIKSKIFEIFMDMLTDKLLENNKYISDINSIKINLSKDVKSFIDNTILEYKQNNTLIKYLFRKNYTLDLNIDITFESNTIILNLKSAKFITIVKAKDAVGSNGIIFNIPNTTFDDIAGHVEVKIRLKEIASLLKDTSELRRFDATVPKGMLLYGKPGTGKTMLASALANYAELPFIYTTANKLIDHGSGNLETMKDIFKRAKDYSPSIIFIDEFDTFQKRQSTNGSRAIINELLTQIDGFDNKSDETVFIIAATNFKDDIDDALLRPGRIELHMEIPTLDKEGREYFINKILKKPSSKNIDKSKLIMYTAGFTGAELKKVANESALYAIRNDLKEISEEIIIEQINIEKYGRRLTNKSILEEIDETAYHEAGHAIISKVLMPNVKIEQITITPRDNTLGFVSFDSENNYSNLSKSDLENKIAISFAGRIAQIKQFDVDGFDTGASNDLKQATRLAYYMVANLGMDENIGYINIDGIPTVKNEQGISSFKTNDFIKEKIEAKVLEILDIQRQRTKKLIDENWDLIEKLAKQLLEKEVLHEEELNQILN